VHYLSSTASTASTASQPLESRSDVLAGGPVDPIVGFVVGRAVGNSVVRHRVSRRLRAEVAARLDVLPASSSTVVRALPSASECDSATLARDLDLALTQLRLR
jgi:ribonuclease P protein component